MQNPLITLIVAAATKNLVIGKGPDLPWSGLKDDMAHFRRETIPHPIIFGRRTFESFKDKEGNQIALPKRLNIVVSRRADYVPKASGAVVASSPEAALELARGTKPQKIIIGGGGEIYRWALGYDDAGNHDPDRCIVDEIFFTQIDSPDIEGDVFFPGIPRGFIGGDPSSFEERGAKVGGEPATVRYSIMRCTRA